MNSVARVVGGLFRLGRWTLAATLAVCVLLSGCAGWNVREEGLHENEMSETVRKARPERKDVDYRSFSDKGRQIERDLHAL